MELVDLLQIVLAALGGSAITKWLDVRAQKKTVETDLTTTLQNLWKTELKHLEDQINKLQILVGLLEQELVHLGGDPVRLRLQVAKYFDVSETDS